MQYTRFTFEPIIKVAHELTNEVIFDLLAEVLVPCGFDSFVAQPTALEAYIPTDKIDILLLIQCLKQFPLPNVHFEVTNNEEPDINWNEEWEKNYFQPLSFADGRCVIRAPFHPASPDAQIELIIAPKMAFGTGNHDTTSLIIEYLLANPPIGKRVLDMGCGTGILGLIALKQGAAALTAVDIDEWAYNNVMENTALNQLTAKTPTICCGDASVLDAMGQFDLILANITRNVLLADMKHYALHLVPQGILVLSGFYQHDIAQLLDEANAQGLAEVTRATTDKEWSMLVVRKV